MTWETTNEQTTRTNCQESQLSYQWLASCLVGLWWEFGWQCSVGSYPPHLAVHKQPIARFPCPDQLGKLHKNLQRSLLRYQEMWLTIAHWCSHRWFMGNGNGDYRSDVYRYVHKALSPSTVGISPALMVMSPSPKFSFLSVPFYPEKKPKRRLLGTRSLRALHIWDGLTKNITTDTMVHLENASILHNSSLINQSQCTCMSTNNLVCINQLTMRIAGQGRYLWLYIYIHIIGTTPRFLVLLMPGAQGFDKQPNECFAAQKWSYLGG